jgi:hypothetical protein
VPRSKIRVSRTSADFEVRLLQMKGEEDEGDERE